MVRQDISPLHETHHIKEKRFGKRKDSHPVEGAVGCDGRHISLFSWMWLHTRYNLSRKKSWVDAGNDRDTPQSHNRCESFLIVQHSKPNHSTKTSSPKLQNGDRINDDRINDDRINAARGHGQKYLESIDIKSYARPEPDSHIIKLNQSQQSLKLPNPAIARYIA